MLRQALRQNPRNDEGWYWLARVEHDPEKRRAYLGVALKINPKNAEARQLLSQLPPPAPKAAAPSDARAAPQARRRNRMMLIAWALVIVSGMATGVLAGLALASRPDALPFLFPPTPTLTYTPSMTYTPTLSPTPTLTPTLTPSPTLSPTATLTPSSTPSVTPTPPGVGRILYTSEKDGDFEIYLMDESGVELAKLTDNDADEFSPKFSPDGRRIAFVSDRDGDAEIFVIDIDGRNEVQLTSNDVEDHNPVWSPDGKMLIFYSERDGGGELYRISVNAGETQRLTENDRADYYPAWQPGRLIAFTSNRGDNSSYQLYAMDESGDAVRQLTESGSVNWYPDWSPECAAETEANPPCRLAWAGFDPATNTFQVFVMEPNGFNVTQVTTKQAIFPAWSPDGRRLAFTSDRNGNQDVYVVDVDCPDDSADCEATLKPLTSDPAAELVSDWGLIPQ